MCFPKIHILKANPQEDGIRSGWGVGVSLRNEVEGEAPMNGISALIKVSLKSNLVSSPL